MNLFELTASLFLDTSDYDSKISASEDKASNFGSKLKSGLGTVAKVTTGAIAATSAAVVAFGKQSIDTGKEFDSSMSQIAATLGLTMEDIQNNVNGAGDTFDALRDKAKQMGSETNFSASQAADGLNILAMSGFDASQSMAMIEDVLHLAAAGSLDMASAASYVSGAMKGFADDSKDAGFYADLMAKGATLANTSVGQLGEAMASGSAGAAAYNQSAESMTVALLRLAEQGEVGSAAGTALSAVMKNLYTPTDQAAKALKELGVAAYDESGQARDANVVIDELSAALSGMSEEEANAYKSTIFGIQGLDAFNKMTVTSTDKQEAWAKALAEASDGAGEAAKQYDTMTDNLQGDIDIWNSSLDGFKIAISDKLMPSVREFVQFGSDGMSKITKAFEENGFEGAMDAFGQVLSDGITMLMEKLPDVVNAGITLFQALLSGITDNLDIIVPAVVEIIVALGTAILENLPLLLEAGIEIFVGLMEGIVEALPELVPVMITVLNELVDVLIENIDIVIEGIVTLVSELCKHIPEILGAIWKIIVKVFDSWVAPGFKAVGEFFSGLWESVKQIFGRVGAWFNEKVIQPVVGFFSGMWDKVKGFASDAWEGIKSVFSVVTDWFKNVFKNAWEGVKKVFSTGGKIFDGIKEGISKVFTTVVNAIIRGINKVISAPFDTINWVLTKLKSVEILGFKPFDWIKLLSVPQIPELARGGILEKGQIGLLEGRGAEAVVPLDQNKAWIHAVASDFAKQMPQASGEVTVNITINQRPGENMEELAQRISEKIAEQTGRRRAVYA